nr:hypothetical protein BDDEJBFL_00156 [Agrobacterium fabrum]
MTPISPSTSKRDDRDHQGPGKIECVVLCEAEIRHVRLHPLAGPIPARWRPFDPGLAAVISAAQPERSQELRTPCGLTVQGRDWIRDARQESWVRERQWLERIAFGLNCTATS